VIAVSGIAEKAGMRVGDVVLRLKGKVIANVGGLEEVAASAVLGDNFPVLVLRARGNIVRRSYLTLRVSGSRPRGALISRVKEGSPAAAGGIEDKDIVIRFNGKEITRTGELPYWVSRSPAGEPSQVVLLRGGKEVTLEVVLGERPENP
jgi:Trypsin-like serine proteases, typically periplasmic, contain C-terminal PDZ domain